MINNSALDRVFDPFSRCLTTSVARKMAQFRADSELADRIQELADKASDDELSPMERNEYETYVRAIDLISLMQSKARKVLKASKKIR